MDLFIHQLLVAIDSIMGDTPPTQRHRDRITQPPKSLLVRSYGEHKQHIKRINRSKWAERYYG